MSRPALRWRFAVLSFAALAVLAGCSSGDGKTHTPSQQKPLESQPGTSSPRPSQTVAPGNSPSG